MTTGSSKDRFQEILDKAAQNKTKSMKRIL